MSSFIYSASPLPTIFSFFLSFFLYCQQRLCSFFFFLSFFLSSLPIQKERNKDVYNDYQQRLPFSIPNISYFICLFHHYQCGQLTFFFLSFLIANYIYFLFFLVFDSLQRLSSFFFLSFFFRSPQHLLFSFSFLSFFHSPFPTSSTFFRSAFLSFFPHS